MALGSLHRCLGMLARGANSVIALPGISIIRDTGYFHVLLTISDWLYLIHDMKDWPCSLFWGDSDVPGVEAAAYCTAHTLS
jgi:hypothetical protein